MTGETIRSRLLLVGGGLPHLFVLEAIARGRMPASDVTIVSAPPHAVWPGMLPGFIGGRFCREEIEVDVRPLAAAAGARFVAGRPARIDSSGRRVLLASAEQLEYDLLSLAVGSEPAGLDVPGVVSHALLLAPVELALGLPDRLARAAAAPEGLAIVVAGGGATGVGTACAIRARLEAIGRGRRDGITIVEGSRRILGRREERVAALAERVLATRGIGIATGSPVAAAAAGAIRLANGASMRSDLLVWAAGAVAPPLVRDAGLAAHAEVFVSEADAAWAGPGLVRSLSAVLAGRPLASHPPVPPRLFLLDTGDGAAIAAYGNLAMHGRAALLLRDRLDRRLMRRFARPRTGTAPA